MYNTEGGKGLPKDRQQNPEATKYYTTLLNEVKKKTWRIRRKYLQHIEHRKKKMSKVYRVSRKH